MSKLIASSIIVVAVGCSSSGPNDPPPSWGVPITGGTMLITKDGARAVVADPDRDKLYVVDLASRQAKGFDLQAGDEPGRLVEDGAGRVHIALRRGAALATLDGDTVTRRAACPEPRGLAWDSAADIIYMACATGELMSFPAAGGDATRVVKLDRDLRDVMVLGNQLLISRFRSAQLLTVDATGAVISRTSPPLVHRFNFGGDFGSGSGTNLINANPAVAWRTQLLADGKVVMLHQRQIDTELHETQGGYGQGCPENGGGMGGPGSGGGDFGFGGGGPVESAITISAPAAAAYAVAPPIHGALPVDFAVDPTGTKVTFAMAGRAVLTTVQMVSMSKHDDDQCGGGDGGDDEDDMLGAPTSVGYTPGGDLVAFYPEYPALVVHTTSSQSQVIPLPATIGYDAGRDLFHTQTQVGIACASCHPEGRDDGLVWTFTNEGKRRTQNLSGGIMARAPYHWSGDEVDLPTLMDDVFGTRMLGGKVSTAQHMSLGPFLNRLAPPAPAPVTDAAAVARGQSIFESAEAGCLACHSGSLYSTKALVQVGTGGMFKVPSLLGVGARAPYMHDGCAQTLADRFAPSVNGFVCGGGDSHGHTSQLSAAQVADLVSYLETL